MQETEETWVQSLGQEDPLEKEIATHLVLLPEKSHGQRRLVGYSPWGRKESDMTKQLYFHYTMLGIFIIALFHNIIVPRIHQH